MDDSRGAQMKFHFILLTSFFFSLSAFAYTFDENVPKAIQDQITNDLAFVSTIKGSNQSDLHKQVFGELSGETYSRFFNSRIESIGMNACGSKNAVACVIPFMDTSKMWLTHNYAKFSHPQIARLMIVFHESRHTEGDNSFWNHSYCPSPFLDVQGKPIQSIWTGSNLAGEPACDETAYGSYGSSTIMLKNISKFCTNCSEKVKMDAEIYADDQFKRIIDPDAIEQMQRDLYHST
jgi:hypothetical protein